jgi:hypothetical protein
MEQKNETTNTRDYPEFQIGYPERNDVRTPSDDQDVVRNMERLHFDAEKQQLVRMTADGKVRGV